MSKHKKTVDNFPQITNNSVITDSLERDIDYAEAAKAADIMLGDITDKYVQTVIDVISKKKEDEWAKATKSGASSLLRVGENLPIVKFIVDSAYVLKSNTIDVFRLLEAQRHLHFFEKLLEEDFTDDDAAYIIRNLKHEDWMKKYMPQLISYVNEAKEDIKIHWLAHFFGAYAKRRISREELFEYMEIVSETFLVDVEKVGNYWGNLDSCGYIKIKSCDYRYAHRLIKCGIGDKRVPLEGEYVPEKYDEWAYFYFDEMSKEFFNIIFQRPKMIENEPVKFMSEHSPSTITDGNNVPISGISFVRTDKDRGE